jgi:hypothetical protein
MSYGIIRPIMAVPEQCPLQSICQKIAKDNWRKNTPREQQIAFLDSVAQAVQDNEKEFLACFVPQGERCQLGGLLKKWEAGTLYLVYDVKTKREYSKEGKYSKDRIDNLDEYRKGQSPQSPREIITNSLSRDK